MRDVGKIGRMRRREGWDLGDLRDGKGEENEWGFKGTRHGDT